MTPEKEKPEYMRAVQDLYYWQYGDPSSFSSMLYTLMGKADRENRFRLSIGFPFEYAAFEEWYHSETQTSFFEKYGLQHGPKK